ncbi:MAG TPA: site-specific integrase [Micromonosporaceae bacterium]
MGVRDDGTPDRRHVSAKTEASVLTKIRDLERDRDAGRVTRPGRAWTVEKWLTHWVETIAAPSVRDNTLAGYRVAVKVHLIPGLGAHRLDRLQPEHLERLYAKMIARGSAPATAHQAHRTIRTALNEAVRRGHIARNPAMLARAPRLPGEEIEPYTVAEVQRLIMTVRGRRNGVRWALALALGLRQGEALGLKWADVDLDAGTLIIRRGRQRPRWHHGCSPPCGRKFGGHCPQRVPARSATADTKSGASRRGIGLPDELIALLRHHKAEQEAEKSAAANLWREAGWLFATQIGEPINPRTDYDEWKRVLKLAGLRDGRLHDARHTAATVLLLLGVPERSAMGIMGWSSSAMATRYQHLTAEIRRDIAKQIGGLIWAKPDDENGTSGSPPV